MDEEKLIQERSELHNKLNKRIQWIVNKDSEASRLSGQIAIYNKWIESYVPTEGKREVKSESKQK